MVKPAVCKLAVAVCVGIWLLAGTSGNAQPAEDVISEIRVAGTQRIEPATVMSYMAVTPGQAFDAELMNQSLKSLFSTGLFADVTLRREGTALIVQVVENPIINRIAFEGNRRIEDEILEAEVTLRPRVVYTRTRVQSDVRRILELYRRSGRFAATVEPKVIQLPQNRVDLAFEVDEGPLTGVRSIAFIGNGAFSDGTLKGAIQTVESKWWRFLSRDDTYDPDRLTIDRDRLRRFYLSEGYADFRVVSSVAELTPDREDFVITFIVEEGQRYRFGTVDVTSELRDLEPQQLLSLITTRDSDWYSAENLEQSRQLITDAAGRLGYAFVDVRPRVTRNRDELTIDIIYEIREGPRVYVERIEITGNDRTHDKVIRREFLVVEGDAFDPDALRQSQSGIRNLDFFERVEVNNIAGSAPDRTVVVVDVDEKSTGELSFGAGFSTTAGFLGDIEIRERNLLGRGQDVRIGLTLAQEQQQADFSFTEPYFLDRELSAGFDLYRRLTDREDESSFKEDNTGGALRLGYQLMPALRHNIRYNLINQDITDVDADASLVIQQQAGKTFISSISNDFYLNHLDSRIDPTQGYFGRYGVDIAGVGGDVRYLRNTIAGGYFLPFFDRRLVLGVNGEVGYIVGLGEDVRLADRFFVGGTKIRGFENAGVGPRDLSTDDALGGNLMGLATAEVTFTLGLPRELGVSGKIFVDAGTLSNIEESGPNIVDSGSIRAAAGVGIAWRSPLGPMRLDIAEAFIKEDHDKTELFRFSFGTRF